MWGFWELLIVIVVLSLAVSLIRWFFKLLSGESSKKNSDEAAEETKIMQEIYNGLSRMEERIEALEIIIMDQDRGIKKT